MIDRFNRFVGRHASGRNVSILFVTVLVFFALFGFVMMPNFSAATDGLTPLDTNFPLTVDLIYEHLARYTDASRRAYVWFAVVDFLYPPTMAAFFAFFWCWLFKVSPAAFQDRLQAFGILLLPFVPALLDWLENIGFLIVVFSYPEEREALAAATIQLKQGKVILHGLNMSLTVFFLVAAALRRR